MNYLRIIEARSKFPDETGYSWREILRATLIYYKQKNGKVFILKNLFGKTGAVSNKKFESYKTKAENWEKNLAKRIRHKSLLD